MTHPSTSYARSKFGEAVHVLAVHPGNVKERLLVAAVTFIAVHREDLPAHLRSDFDEIKVDLTKRAELFPGDGRLRGTLTRMRRSTASGIAERICALSWELDHIEDSTT
jgi:hypothetical protein